MTPERFHRIYMPAVRELLPEYIDRRVMSAPAQAMILAIGMQETEFNHRAQVTNIAIKWWQDLTSPAAGFLQFERIGIRGVLEHPSTAAQAKILLDWLGYPDDVNTIWRAMRHNDLLCLAFGRLALWRHPAPLPEQGEVDEAWQQYLDLWSPGKPHPDKWADNYARAWEIVLGLDD